MVSTFELELGGEDAERVFRGDEVNAGDAWIGDQGAEHLRSVNGTAGTSYGESQGLRGGWVCSGHSVDYR